MLARPWDRRGMWFGVREMDACGACGARCWDEDVLGQMLCWRDDGDWVRVSRLGI